MSRKNRNRNTQEQEAPVEPEAIVEQPAVEEEEVIETPEEVAPVVEEEIFEIPEPTEPETAPVEEEIVLEDPESTLDTDAPVISLDETGTTTVASVANKSDIVLILQDSGLSLEEKLAKIAGTSVTQYAGLLHKLIDYNNEMSTGIIDEAKGAAKQYDLYSTIMSVLKESDREEFDFKFNLLNLVFACYAKSGFEDRKLFRFERKWSYGVDELGTYRTLVILLTSLGEPESREKNLRTIDFGKLQDVGKKLTDDMVTAIERYYKA